ncbi:MAG: hypothetical protein JSS61_04445 [Verrucomicrobia bacterium]|nr:hypothetical protein [Verrucomicrobiota bacterium]
MKRRLKWALYLAAPALLLLIPFRGGLNLNNYFSRIVLEPQKTGITTFQFYDEARSRPLVTEVWYPIDKDAPAGAATGVWLRCPEARDAPLSLSKQKYPLIMISHGYGGDRYNISWLAEVLAANGFIVAAMDHWGNTWNNKIPELSATPWERPKDITYVLDQILENSLFKDRIDRNRIGFAGYSLGGATGLWIAGAQAREIQIDQLKAICSQELEGVLSADVIEGLDFTGAFQSYRDPRVSAMVVMAPALGCIFAESSLEEIEIPVYIVAPEKDAVVPTESNARVFAKKIAKASLKILPGDATHYVFLNRPSLMGKRFLNPKYAEDPARIDRSQIHREVAHSTVTFFNKHL